MNKKIYLTAWRLNELFNLQDDCYARAMGAEEGFSLNF